MLLQILIFLLSVTGVATLIHIKTKNNINSKSPERVLALGDYSYQS